MKSIIIAFTILLSVTAQFSNVKHFDLNCKIGSPKTTLKVGSYDSNGFNNNLYTHTGTFISTTGYNNDFINGIEQFSSFLHTYITSDYVGCIENLKTNKVDILGGISLDYKDEDIVFSEEPEGFYYASLYSQEDSLYNINSLSTFDGAKIGVLDYDKTELLNSLSEWCNDRFTYNVTTYGDIDTLTDLLNDSSIDLILSRSNDFPKDTKLVSQFDKKDFYFAFNKKNANYEYIYSNFNSAHKALLKQYPNLFDQLNNKWYGVFFRAPLEFTNEELTYIRSLKNKKINAVYETNNIPYSYKNKDDEVSGIMIGLFKYYCELIDINYEFIGLNSIAECKDYITTGKAEVIPNIYFGDYESSSSKILFTESKLANELMIIENRKANNEIIVRQHNSNISEMYLSQDEDKYVIGNDVDSSLEIMEEVYKGRAKYGLINKISLDYFMQNIKYSKVLLSHHTGLLTNLCLGMSPSADPLLTSIFRKTIVDVDAEEVDNIVFSESRYVYRSSFFEFISNSFLTIMIVLLVLLILSIIIVVMVSLIVLKKKNRLLHIHNIDYRSNFYNINYFIENVNKKIKNSDTKFDVIVFTFNTVKGSKYFLSEEESIKLYIYLFELLKTTVGSSSDYLFTRLNQNTFSFIYFDHAKLINIILPSLHYQFGKYGDLVCSETSFGICSSNEGHATELIEKAIKAIHNVYNNAEFYYQEYNDEIKEKDKRERLLFSSFDESLYRNKFILYYQPQYDIFENKIIGIEALVRWQLDDSTLIPPNEFISLFEESGHIARLDEYVLEEGCRTIRKVLDMGLLPYPLSINISAYNLKNDLYYESLLQIIDRYNIPHNLIKLELTETAFVENKKNYIRFANFFKKNNILIVMNDFGSGYSSLSSLQEMDLNEIKLDLTFINSKTVKGKEVLEHLLHMFKSIDSTVIVEGVETQEQIDYLKSQNIKYVQGYYYSRPVPCKNMLELIEKEQ